MKLLKFLFIICMFPIALIIGMLEAATKIYK